MKTMYKVIKQKNPIVGFCTMIFMTLVLLPVLLNAQQAGSQMSELSEKQTGIVTIQTPITTEFATYTPYRVPAFRPTVGDYESNLRPDFSNVIVPDNDFSWDRFFSASDRAALLRNQVALRQEAMGSFAQAYAGMNDKAEFLPFITTDAAMSGLRASAEEAYREAQRDHLAPDLDRLLTTIGRALNSSAANESDRVIKQDILRVLAWTETARMLLDPAAVPQLSVDDKVRSELSKIKGGTPDNSSIFNKRTIDYGIFVPTKGYRVNVDLERYYQATTWLGQVGLRVRSNNGSLNKSEARMAFILARTLDVVDTREQDRLNDIIAVERFFAGEKADVLTPQIAAATMRAYYGFQYDGGFSYLADNESLEKLVRYMERSLPSRNEQEPVMRLLPVGSSLSNSLYARLQKNSNVRQGNYGNVLAAALGAEQPTDSRAVKSMRTVLARIPVEEWVKDMQWTTLFTAQSFVGAGNISDGYPRFMRTDGWKERREQSALGVWTAYANERGILSIDGMPGQAKHVEKPLAADRADMVGYVEPDPAAWSAVASQARFIREGLTERMRGNLIDPALEEKLLDIENTAAQFARIAAAQLQGRTLTSDQSGLVASAPQRIAAWETYSDATLQGDNSMLAASAQSNGRGVGPATGHPVALYVIAPNPVEPGELVLMRGAVYSYYETELDADTWMLQVTGMGNSRADVYAVPVEIIETPAAKLTNVTASVNGNERRGLVGAVEVDLESSVVRRSSGALWYTVLAPGYDGADVITTVVDLSGRRVFQSFPLPIENGERFDMVPVDEMKSGQYFIRVSDITGRPMASGRFMVVR